MKKTLLILLTALFWVSGLWGQSPSDAWGALREKVGKGSYLEALPLAERLKAQTPSGLPEYLNVCDTLGQIYMELCDYGRSVEEYRNLIKLAGQLPDKKRLLPLYVHLANCWNEEEEADSASFYYGLLLKEQQNESPILLAEANIGMAEIFRKKQLWEECFGYYQRADSILSPLLTRNDFQAGYLNALANNNKGIAYILVGGYDSAFTLTERAWQWEKDNLDKQHPAWIGVIASKMLLDLMVRGDIQTAMLEGNQALDITEKAIGRNNHKYVNMLTNLGALHEKYRQDYVSALAIYTEAQSIYDKLKPYKVVTALEVLLKNGFAQIKHRDGDYEQAEKYYMEAQKSLEVNGRSQTVEYATVLNNLGMLYLAWYQYTKAEAYLLQSNMLDKKLTNNESDAYLEFLNNMGELRREQRRYEEADSLYALSIERAKHFGIVLFIAQITQNRALGRLLAGQPQEAIPLFQNVLDLMNSNPSQFGSLTRNAVIHNIGLAHLANRTFQSADSLLTLSSQSMGKSYRLPHHTYATSLCKVANVRQLRQQYDSAFVYYMLGLNGHYDYFQVYQAGLITSVRDRMWKEFNEQAGPLFTMLEEMPQDKRSIEMLTGSYNHVLRTKGYLLQRSQKLKQRVELLAASDTATRRVYLRWADQQKRLSEWGGTTPKGLQRLGVDWAKEVELAQVLERQLIYLIPEARSLLQPAPAPTWQQIQKRLKPGEALVDIVAVNRIDLVWQKSTKQIAYYAYILTPQTQEAPLFLPLRPGDSLLAAYEKYQNAVQTGDKGSLQQLYTVFWKDIAQQIGDAQVVYVAADGIYNLLNLNALADNNGKYLVEGGQDIWLITTARHLLDSTRHGFPSSATAVLFGNPNGMMGDELVSRNLTSENEKRMNGCIDLPNALKEVEDVARKLQQAGWKTETYVENAATEEQLKSLVSPTVLHIAAHGFYPNDSQSKVLDVVSAMYESGLVLAGGCVPDKSRSRTYVENGKLTANEAQFLDLSQTDLVVLSACGSGLGKLRQGEGVAGLQKGFMVAGVRNLLMTLWDIDSPEAARMMGDFYDLWVESGNLHQALRTAQREAVAKGLPPFYWAAFVHLSN